MVIIRNDCNVIYCRRLVTADIQHVDTGISEYFIELKISIRDVAHCPLNFPLITFVMNYSEYSHAYGNVWIYDIKSYIKVSCVPLQNIL